MQTRTISVDGLEHLKRFEGFRPYAYDDFVPNEPFEAGSKLRGTLTIGYGHTGHAAFPGHQIDTAQGEALLSEDLADARKAIYNHVKAPLQQGQYDALCSFIYNVGTGNFQRSTLLKKLNAGDVDGAGMEFRRWIYSKGKRLKGLEIRRTAEAALFDGSTAYGLIDIDAMARDAGEMLRLGAGVRPDAVEERGIQKPAHKSKTIQASALGLSGAAVSAMASMVEAMDWRVQLLTSAWMGACALFLIWNRLREHREGEH